MKPPSPHENSIKIAVLEANYENMEEQLERLEQKVDMLLEAMNRGKGAYTASLVIVGGLAAFVAEVVHWIVNSAFGKHV